MLQEALRGRIATTVAVLVVPAHTLLVHLLCRNLTEYDAQNNPDLKDAENGGKFKDVEEDEFQKRVDAKLQAKAVDPDDKSVGAYFTRFRNLALRGISHDVHDDFKQDQTVVDMHNDAEKFDPRTEQVSVAVDVTAQLPPLGQTRPLPLNDEVSPPGSLLTRLVWMCWVLEMTAVVFDHGLVVSVLALAVLSG